MEEWFKCKKCGQIFLEEMHLNNKCPFCGHDSLSKVTLKSRNISPTYTYTVGNYIIGNTLTQRKWMLYEIKEET